MAEEVKVDSDSNASTTRQRKKRKWDQPAESVIAATASIPGFVPLIVPVPLAGMAMSGSFPSLVGVYPSLPFSSASTGQQNSRTLLPAQQNAAAIVQKINQDLASKGLMPPSKIQDELIAREIVINDADPGVRYKLTKRQTQEEIQSKTGAVVITRGKYKLPNGPVDNEKPLYLHISAGAHLRDTLERVRAVDQAAALVDEILKQGRPVTALSSTTQLGTMSAPMSAVVFVDFEADGPSDLVNRIQGPNGQYINHIMNETGAIVLLKGGACEGSFSGEIPQPLHLLISADNAKSLEGAKHLAENLLETIRAEFVGPRPPYFPPPFSYNLQPPLPSRSEITNSHVVPPLSHHQLSGIIQGAQSADRNSASVLAWPGSLKNYSAVPPPKQLLMVDAGSDKGTMTPSQASLLSISSDGPTVASALVSNSTGRPGCMMAYNQLRPQQQTYGIYPQASQGSEQRYSAYSGVYPQASPLQQVALALQRPALNACTPSRLPDVKPMSNLSQGQSEKQRRKFQETPLLRKEMVTDHVRPGYKGDGHSSVSYQPPMPLSNPINTQAPGTMQPPPGSMGLPPLGSMLPPPPVRMQLRPPGTMPPPLSTIRSAAGSLLPISVPVSKTGVTAVASTGPKSILQPALPTLVQSEKPGIKLVEYGEDEDEEVDGDAKSEQSGLGPQSETKTHANGKPFWAV